MSTLPQSEPFFSTQSFNADVVRDLGTASTLSPKWYAVFTLARHEKRVLARCEERHIESFLPLYKAKHRWKNRCTVDLELPLFPSYSFVRIDPRIRVQVLQVPGVVSIVSSGRELLPLPDDYINSLRDGLLAHRIEPHPGVSVGDWVRITSGPMAGAEGVLERRKNDLRVVLRLDMLARSVSVEVSATDIEFAGATTDRSGGNLPVKTLMSSCGSSSFSPCVNRPQMDS
jgi:transcription antitermination factor NusG